MKFMNLIQRLDYILEISEDTRNIISYLVRVVRESVTNRIGNDLSN